MSCASLTQAASLTLGLEEGEDVAFTDGTLNVADKGTTGELRGRLSHEGDADLDDSTTRSGTAEDLFLINIKITKSMTKNGKLQAICYKMMLKTKISIKILL